MAVDTDEANAGENADKGKAETDARPKKDDAAPSPTKKKRPVRRALAAVGLALLALILVLVVRASMFRSVQVAVAPVTDLAVDDAKAAEHLATAVRHPTVSFQDRSKIDPAPFVALHASLKEMFPAAHQALDLEVIGEHSLLYTWKGKDPKADAVLLMAHQDVVPVEPGTESAWTKPPFSGEIAEGYIWGRGTMDFKLGVVGILEAVETLLKMGYAPRRTLYLAFGHDEEISGTKGAARIVTHLKDAGAHLAYVLDEGMVITEGIMPGINAPIALIGLAEKGYLTLELVVPGQGGHSSMPPRPGTAGILARAIDRLESQPMPARLEGPVRHMFETVGPEMPFGRKIVFANLWLLEGVLKGQLAKSPATDALIRTTTAVTMLEGSVKENVLPARARAVVNFRLLPGDTMESVIAQVKATIADDRVQVSPLPDQGQNPSPVSDQGPGYRAIEKTVRQIVPDAIVAPSIVVGATDARYYQPIADAVYRFSPQRMGPEDRARYHGTNERLSVKNFGECVRFYAQLIRNSDEL